MLRIRHPHGRSPKSLVLASRSMYESGGFHHAEGSLWPVVYACAAPRWMGSSPLGSEISAAVQARSARDIATSAAAAANDLLGPRIQRLELEGDVRALPRDQVGSRRGS